MLKNITHNGIYGYLVQLLQKHCRKSLAERSHAHSSCSHLHQDALKGTVQMCHPYGTAQTTLYELREGTPMCTYCTEESLPIQHTKMKNLLKYKLKEVYFFFMKFLIGTVRTRQDPQNCHVKWNVDVVIYEQTLRKIYFVHVVYIFF